MFNLENLLCDYKFVDLNCILIKFLSSPVLVCLRVYTCTMIIYGSSDMNTCIAGVIRVTREGFEDRSLFKVYPFYVKDRIKLFKLVMDLNNFYIEIVKLLFLWKIYKKHVYLMYDSESIVVVYFHI